MAFSWILFEVLAKERKTERRQTLVTGDVGAFAFKQIEHFQKKGFDYKMGFGKSI